MSESGFSVRTRVPLPKGTRIPPTVYQSIEDLILQVPPPECSDRQIAEAHGVSRSVVARIRRLLGEEMGSLAETERRYARLGFTTLRSED